MTVLSWNMLFSNQRPDEALAFIRDCGADVVCLQEVPEPFLNSLETLPYETVSAVETSRRTKHGDFVHYLAILSRYPIGRHAHIPLPERAVERLRSRLFVKLMIALGIWGQGFGVRHQLVADVRTPQGTARILNLHLPLQQSAWRAEEFERAMMNLDPDLPAIVCGDFNTFESRRIQPVAWLLGESFSSLFSSAMERRQMQQRFRRHALANPLAGTVTHPISHSQLDHILCSKHFIVNRAQVVENRHGSDHHPVLLALDYI